eukprot:CAMPEP_0197529336 /NCGR_PEP_ID=MMETSP1318-20131121/28076_1 /TAXON_ID=552666 /ORGANISM="Partenskyella glossopodia, Strain RCC365" /LENGTH=39 /DNA_ID= /DNA_START= /DNA_END= /DNA_ORIENTATION=
MDRLTRYRDIGFGLFVKAWCARALPRPSKSKLGAPARYR